MEFSNIGSEERFVRSFVRMGDSAQLLARALAKESEARTKLIKMEAWDKYHKFMD